MPFIGREQELADLSEEFAAPRPSLVIVYGRRRVGKSTLLQQAAKGVKGAVYFQATIGDAAEGLAAFRGELTRSLGDDGYVGGLSDWLSLLNWLAKAAESRKGLVVIFDEFPYLSDKQDDLPSIIQKLWDSGAMARGNLKLILCGSLISYMQALLTERHPLFGRRTMALELQPMSLREAADFLPGYSPADVIAAYGVFGGIPRYLELCDPKRRLRDNVVDLVLSKSGQLFDEPEFLLRSELREPKRYANVISAIAGGATKSSEILGRMGLNDSSQLTPYLDQLIRLGFVERRRSFGASDRERDARYAVVDPLTRFWYRLVRPNLSAISRGFGGQVFDRAAQSEFPDYMGAAFEDVCREHLRRFAQERLWVPAHEIGKIWSADYDLDIAGRLLDRSWVFGECKWTAQRVGVDALEKLKRNAAAALLREEPAAVHFTLFAKSGFTAELERQAGVDAAITLYELGEVATPIPSIAPGPSRGG
jgi:hypothetical protein